MCLQYREEDLWTVEIVMNAGSAAQKGLSIAERVIGFMIMT